ncbi:MAG TPA: ATP-binding protein [Paucimonas sp.]|nr:ATP-binding protein [Paucimonas sp.]
MNELARFDRDLTLAELLRATPRAKLERAIDSLAGNGWQLVDAEGVALLGPGVASEENVAAIDIRVDVEVVGRLLVAGAARERIDILGAWIDMAFAGASRYQMASDLHVEAVAADYTALQEKHAALLASEARYRELSEHLEQRVREQVEVIERAQRQLYQAEKMASVGSLAAGMAHEINNPIGFIRSNLTTAQSYVGKLRQALLAFHRGDAGAAKLWRELDIEFALEDFPVLLAESAAGAERIARIVANLKAYASIDCVDAVPIDLNDAVRAVMAVASDQLPAGISFETDLQPLPSIVCDQSRINQVLFSLVQNARQAMTSGVIHISTRIAQDEIRIAVRDDGCGIEPAILNRIFDPFFTTRDVGKGMGLGLTVSRDIVNAHQGYIEVDSTVGAGSTFTVCLPLQSVRRSDAPSDHQPEIQP